ncbi:MAG: protein-glutamate O-methyltransferase CheR [Pseudomonadota bacterium]
MSAAAKHNQALAAQAKTNEFELSDRDFNNLRRLVSEHTGISLSDQKRDLVYARLAKRLRVHGMTSFRAYCELLEQDPGEELEHFTNAITTNLTSFFREKHHFEFLQQDLVPMLLERYQKNRRLRIWSAGCSTGEEPYSLAITLREAIPDIDGRDIRILATDLDSNVVKTGAAGVYQAERINGLDSARIKRWFQRGKGGNQGRVRVADELRKLITFRQLNLMHDWPMRGQFDVIFCRNVVIYFDKPTQQVLFDRFANIMQPDSYLFIGHSETLHNVSERFQLVGKTIYRRLR